MTSIGFRAPGALSPPQLPPVPTHRADARRVAVAPVVPRAVAAAAAPSWVRLGRVSPRSAARYLSIWAAVLFVAQLVVLVVSYLFLWAIGVLGSVSRALALLSDKPPASGLVPALQPQHVLPTLVLVSLLLSFVFLVAAVGVVLVHNATTTLTGGVVVRVRPEPRRPRA